MSITAQEPELAKVKSTIDEFFKAFHQQDTTALKTMVKGNISIQSIAINKEGHSVLTENKFQEFLKSIASIPKNNTFEEKIKNYDIKIDGPMASVWTPYEFWYNGKFSHCGVNSFQLIKEDNSWKIIYLVDTRRRENCL